MFKLKSKRLVLWLTLIAVFTFGVKFAMSLNGPPRAYSIVIWVHWPDNLQGKFRLNGKMANEFLEELWSNTSSDDWHRYSQYRIMNVFWEDESGRITKGIHVKAGVNNKTYNVIEELAKKAVLGELFLEEEAEERVEEFRSRIGQIHRVYDH